MWRCDYCRKRFEDRAGCINHARGWHSRDYTACRCLHLTAPAEPAGAVTLAWRLVHRSLSRLLPDHQPDSSASTDGP
jgi:hypothetical protein